MLDIRNRDVILGMEWLRENKIKIDCVRNYLEFEYGEVWKCDPHPLPTINQESCHEALFKSKHLIMISNSELPLLGKLTSNDQANRLPSHSNFDHSMTFKPGSKIPNGPLYRLTWEEEEALMRYLDQMTAEGKIRRSGSQAASPILFVKKKDGSLRLCVDYHAINAITERDIYPLLLITELYDRIQNTTMLTKLDLKNGYNLICIPAGEEWKTAFKTKFGLYEYLVMPFALSNASATFQRMMDSVLQPSTCRNVPGEVTCAYLHDVLIYSCKGSKDHVRRINEVLGL